MNNRVCMPGSCMRPSMNMPSNHRMAPNACMQKPPKRNEPPCVEEKHPNDPLHKMPLAMGYVPIQRWNQTYDYHEGLCKGTIFPCLDLPFRGCVPQGIRYQKGGM